LRNVKVRVGSGAGYAGDRWEPAIELAEHGDIDFLAFECLAERTIARENLSKIRNPEAGYNPLLLDRVRAVLPMCLENRVRVLSNMGAANPHGAGKRICEVAAELGFPNVRSAIVLGDDVREIIKGMPGLVLAETRMPLEEILPRMSSANAYLGADAILPALETGAEIITTGRVADPSLFLAPIMFRNGWSYDDYDKIASGTVAGHLLECAGQLTGGYFADPGPKDVEGLAELGFPFVDVDSSGLVEVGKVKGSGGIIDEMTCAEQLLYEIHDPASYITPDCVLDVSDVHFEVVGKDRVQVFGAKARPRTNTYKVSVGYHAGYKGVGEISYAGINSVERARLAGKIVQERFQRRSLDIEDLRIDLVGMESLHGTSGSRSDPYEVRLRVAGKTMGRKGAEVIGQEVETLYTNGPAGGAGATKSFSEIFAVQSVMLPREFVTPTVLVESLG